MKIKAIYNTQADTKTHFASQKNGELGSGTRYPLCWDNANNKMVRSGGYYTESEEKVNCIECLDKVAYIKTLEN